MEPTTEAAPVEQSLSTETGEVPVDEEKEQLISTWDKIIAQRERIKKLTAEESIAKKEHAAAKAALDKGWEQLGTLIDDEKKGYEPNLFNQPKEPAEDEAWRKVFIGDIGLGEAITEKLIQADINELGKLADWSNGGKLLTDLPGIGTQTAEKINDALAAFWQKRNDAEAAKKAAAAAAGKTADEQKARKAPAADKKKADEQAVIAAGLAAMGLSGGQPPTVDTESMTKGW